MRYLRNLLQKIHPVCPVKAGESGPYEYVQFIKDRNVMLETPKTCLEFLKIGEFRPRLYTPDPKRTLWVTKDELESIRTHEHTVIRELESV